MIKVTLIVISLVLLSSCFNSSEEPKVDLVGTLNSYSKIIASRDLDQLATICTPNGFNSMMDFTDSLRRDKVVNKIVSTFGQEKILFSQTNDSTFEVSTLQSERPLPGGSSGLIVLKFTQNQFKIEAYLGVLTVIN